MLVNEGQLSAYGKGSRFGLIHDTFGFKAADDKIEASTHGQSVLRICFRKILGFSLW